MRTQSSSVRLILKIATILIVGISIFIYAKLGQRIDVAIYDKLLLVKDRNARPDITIVELDQKTLKYINTPNDDVHAQFMKKLFYLAPYAVIIDKSLQFNLDKEAILKSITSIQNLYLPVNTIQNANLDLLDEYYPSSSHTERLIKNSGHFLFNTDGDARIRSINLHVKMLKIQGVNERPENYKPSIKNDELVPYAVFNAYDKNTIMDVSSLNNINQLGRFFIPYHSSKYQKVSYIDILKNEVDISLITGKYIIIGQNIDGTTLYKTPYGMATSLEIHAQALQGFLDQKIIQKISPIAEYIIAIVAILISILIIWAFMPKVALSLNILLIVFIILIDIAAFYYNLWFSPLPSILGVILAYPLWSHYRMLHMTKFIDHELRAINPSSLNLLRSLNQGLYNNQPTSMWFQQDAFSQHISQFRAMIANHENMRQFIINNMNAMPDVIIVTNLQGDMIVNNHAAEIWLSKNRYDYPT
jgi:CHASE2 domain-containing sensor protein